ncbi:hypothetical protein AB0O28_11750 [Microbispora sp. NPDC088329]|uniref:esterase/lipase family protein n=1 Tax=Microbispora sp. NPDC088329 TaxID=3154869 RepID=UPI003430E9B7
MTGHPDVVVFVPGIAGSALADRHREIWSGNPFTMLRGLPALAAPQAGDGVVATRVIRGIGVLPGFLSVDFYGKLGGLLRRGLGLLPGRNYHEFPYDWRRDNRISAAGLVEKAQRWLHTWRADSGNEQARLVFVAHSMGGLVARYAVEKLGLWTSTRAVITIGTPHRGAPKAAHVLSSGIAHLGWAQWLTRTVRAMPSAYQLLPVYPCVADGDRKLRLAELDGLEGLPRGKVKEGAAFLYEIEAAARANAEREKYELYLNAVVGGHQPTIGAFTLTPGRTLTPQVIPVHGDGTVPRPSAYPIEWDRPLSSLFVAGKHSSLAGADPAAQHVVGALRALAEDWGLAGYRDPAASVAGALTLDCPDVIVADEPLVVRATARPAADLRLSVEPLAGDGPVCRREGGDSWVIPGLRAGCYRVTARSADPATSPVSDLVTVLPPYEEVSDVPPFAADNP